MKNSFFQINQNFKIMKTVVYHLKTIFILIFRVICMLIRKTDKFLLKIIERNPDFAKLFILSSIVYIFTWILYFICFSIIIFSPENVSAPSWMYRWESLNFNNFWNPSFIGSVEIICSLYFIRIVSYLVKK